MRGERRENALPKNVYAWHGGTCNFCDCSGRFPNIPCESFAPRDAHNLTVFVGNCSTSKAAPRCCATARRGSTSSTSTRAARPRRSSRRRSAWSRRAGCCASRQPKTRPSTARRRAGATAARASAAPGGRTLRVQMIVGTKRQACPRRASSVASTTPLLQLRLPQQCVAAEFSVVSQAREVGGVPLPNFRLGFRCFTKLAPCLP